MKKKELKNLAMKIANAEYIIQTSSDKKEINDAKKVIIEVSNYNLGLDDLMTLEELIETILSQKLNS